LLIDFGAIGEASVLCLPPWHALISSGLHVEAARSADVVQNVSS
jgi:hypothetical protein